MNSKFALTILIILYSYLQAHAQSPAELLKASMAPVSINPRNNDYTDLQPLKKFIGNSRVVVLGEISHDDGSSLMAKSRLVKFLHQEMGFEVLAWEAGMLDAQMMDKAFEQNLSLDETKTFLMYGGWDNSELVHPVFEYVQQSWTTSRPLHMAGFDAARPPKGKSNVHTLLNQVSAEVFIPDIQQDKIYADSLIAAVCGYVGNAFSKKLSETGRTKAENYFETLYDSLSKKNHHLKIKDKEILNRQFFFKSFIRDIEIWKAGKYLSNQSWNLIRDNAMGDRFAYLLENLYPGKKVIIWAATSHLTRNQHLIFRGSEISSTMNNSVSMGQYVYNQLRGQLYTIAFTAYQGERGMLFKEGDRRKSYEYKEKIPDSATGTFEALAHKTGKPFLIIDLKNQQQNSWLKKQFIARPLGFIEDNAVWSEVVDAFFFIDQMQPDVKMLLPK